ncbi:MULTISPECIES: Gx transporter family protein [Caproicibacterium]|uniref:Gx transporter family protein n=1 Tax=Caproicibacterium argilliputei TaxID=3030016 RepID=A0AA97D8W7_9FIRM|nr:Gx transporter family protein [Caproicibacterium argilliputei]WOC31454.1 Gx transporter family protein [Caproicibacterium argilliputei]
MHDKLRISRTTRRVAFIGMLGALALVLSALEAMLPPLPMLPPGAKLGLSNLVTMYAAGAVGLLPALAIALLKGLFAGAMSGSVALLMSTAGGLASTLVMWVLLQPKSQPFGFLGLGVAGALTHNMAQLGVAALLTTPAVSWYAPWLLLFGVLAGILTGLVLRAITPLLERFKP